MVNVRTGASHEQAMRLCAETVKSRGSANMDQLFRLLVENGYEPNDAQRAVEDYVRSNMMKKTRKPA